jgi:glyoxylase-like metal-dependent hydrolase (beta-lactamase superfamily II)
LERHPRGEQSEEIFMLGTWTITRNECVPIHTFTAPEDGWLVTSHMIELPSQLLVIDAQYRLSYAGEVVRYAAALNKPTTRLYVAHYHPDHLLGAAAFDTPLFAFASVAEKVAAVGDRVAQEEHAIVGDDIPAAVRRPDRTVDEGVELIDGVRIWADSRDVALIKQIRNGGMRRHCVWRAKRVARQAVVGPMM